MRNERQSSAGVTRDDMKARVQRLVMVANNLFHRGSYETAFDSLMKAYLLDPTDPHVIACEQLLLPAWEMMRKRGTLGDSEIMKMNGQLDAMLVSLNETRSAPKPAALTQSEFQKTAEEIRIEKLRQKKETERAEKERAAFREASRPRTTVHAPIEQKPQPPASPAQGGLFSKLRQGKFLG
jgi:hypothetical protein